ncbi:MAG: D-glycero-beta-D-manno-heptose 1,7-bisphosphate 7-phosphatase [Armatimonadaceae bacterium]
MENPAERPAVFLDRDGVLNRYLPGDYVTTPAELELIPGAAEAVRRLNDTGYPVFVISNQQGVAKGLMTPADLAAVDEKLHREIAAAGGTITKSYYCPHRAGECSCRKPLPGLLLRAAEEHHLDLSRSVFIGDTESDAAAARAAGVGRFFLVLSGKHPDAEIAKNPTLFPTPPNGVYANLAKAVQGIVEAELVENTETTG